MKDEKEELMDFSARWDEAMISNDAEKIGAFMSDDWLIVGSGGTSSKATFLQQIRSGQLKHNRMDNDEIIIKIYGDTGILVSKGTSAGIYNGQSFSLYEWSTNVFIKKKGQWLCVSTMLTPVNK